MIITARLHDIIKTKFFADSVIVFCGNLVNRLLSMLSFVLIARNLSVKDYGIMTVMISVIMTITDLINSGMNASIVRFSAIYNAKGQYDTVWKLFFTSFVNMTVISSFAIGAIILAARPICMALFRADYSELLILSAFGILTTFYFSLYSGLLQGLQRFKLYLIQTIGFAAIKVAAIIFLLSIHQMNIKTIILIFVLSPLLAIAIGFAVSRELPLRWLTYDPAIVVDVFHFGKWMVLWSFVSIVQSRIDTYLLGPLYSIEAVSYFDVANKFTTIIMVAFSSYSTVLAPRMAAMLDSLKLRREVTRASQVCSVICVGLVMAAVFFPFFISWIFGNKYSSAITPLRIMLLSLIPYVFTLPFNQALAALGHSKAFFITATIGLIVNTVSSLLLIRKYGAIGSGVSFFFVNISSLICSYLFYRYYAKDVRKSVTTIAHAN